LSRVASRKNLNSSGRGPTPPRSIDDDSHQTSRDKSGNGEGQQPSRVTPCDHAPVESLVVTVAKSDTHGGSDNALSGRDGKGKAGGHDDSDSGSELHGESTGGRLESQTVTKVAHDVVSVSPETNDDTSSSVTENPDGDGRLLGDVAGVPDEVDGGERTDSVGDIVGSVGERRGGSSQDLEERVQVLSLVVEVSSTSVHVNNVSGKTRSSTGLLGNDVLVDSVHEGLPDSLGKVLGQVPGTGIGLLNILKSLSASDVGLLGNSMSVGLGTVDLSLLGGLEVLHVGNGGLVKVHGLEVLTGGVTGVVVLDDLDVDSLRRVGDGTALEEHGTEEKVVPAHGPVVHGELAVQPGQEEETDQEDNTTGNTEDGSGDLTSSPVVKVKGSSSLPDDQHGKNTRGDTEVNGDHDETPLKRVGTLQDSVLGDQKDKGSEGSGNTGGDNPGSNNLGDSLVVPGPRNSTGSDGSDSKTDDSTSDTVGSGNGKTDGSSNSKPGRRTNQSAQHSLRNH
jgi:hypothetical protein